MRMRSVAPMRTAKIGYILVSVALCVLGAVLIAVPEFSAAALGVIGGVTLIVFGVVRLIGYFSRDLYRLAFQYDLTLGILLIALGAILLIHPAGLMTFFCITYGIFILSDGLFKIQIAMEAKSFGLRQWWLVLVLAVLTGLGGLVLMLRPGEGSHLLMVLLGITLLTEGVLNGCTVLTAVKIVRNQIPDKIETDTFEEDEP